MDNEQYNDDDLVEIKMPLNLPYMSSWGSYERVDGEIEFDGIHFNYVKRKVSNDTLYLMCLPNRIKTELYESLIDYSKQVNDSPQDNQDGQQAKKGCFFSLYNEHITRYQFVSSTVFVKQETYQYDSRLSHSFIDQNFRPPKAGMAS